MQSVLYGRTENLFGTHKERLFLLEYRKQAVCFAASAGCRNLVQLRMQLSFYQRRKPRLTDMDMAYQVHVRCQAPDIFAIFDYRARVQIQSQAPGPAPVFRVGASLFCMSCN